MSKERRLGRGLEALLGKVASQQTDADLARRHASPETPPHDTGAAATASLYVVYPTIDGEPDFDESERRPGPVTAAMDVSARPVETSVSMPGDSESAVASRLPIGNIDANPHQPRRDFDENELRQLAESLASHGLLQPIVVRRHGARYQVVAGERRLRAAMLAGWTDVPVHVVEADDRQMAELAIVENLQRKDLNAMEKASSFRGYLEEYACTQEELAARLQIDRSTVSNFIRLLELPGAIQDALRAGRLTQGHARALLPLGEERDQLAFCERIEAEGWSVRQTEAAVQNFLRGDDLATELGIAPTTTGARATSAGRSDHLTALEQEFRSALGAKVKLSHNARGRGKIVIAFKDHDEFERLRRLLCDMEPRGMSKAG